MNEVHKGFKMYDLMQFLLRELLFQDYTSDADFRMQLDQAIRQWYALNCIHLNHKQIQDNFYVAYEALIMILYQVRRQMNESIKEQDYSKFKLE